MPKQRPKRRNALAVFSLALSVAGYLLLQSGALPNKKKKVSTSTSVEIMSATRS